MQLQKQNRILCLDYGEKRIGVAISDELGLTAQPNRVIERKNINSDLSIILDVIASFEVGELVVGMPINMNGSLGPQAKKTQAFIDRLKTELDIPIHQWDERLSTSAVKKVLIKAGVRRQKRKKVIDIMEAQYILQGYLDYKNLSTEYNKEQQI